MTTPVELYAYRPEEGTRHPFSLRPNKQDGGRYRLEALR